MDYGDDKDFLIETQATGISAFWRGNLKTSGLSAYSDSTHRSTCPCRPRTLLPPSDPLDTPLLPCLWVPEISGELHPNPECSALLCHKNAGCPGNLTCCHLRLSLQVLQKRKKSVRNAAIAIIRICIIHSTNARRLRRLDNPLFGTSESTVLNQYLS